jgi:outer membrane biosynthesis protein TonB
MTRHLTLGFAALLLAAAPPSLAKEELIPTGKKRRAEQGPPNPLREVSGDMKQVAGRIGKANTGDETQKQQDAILEKLQQLVEQAQKQQQQQQQQSSSSKSQAKRRQKQQPQPKPDPKKSQKKQQAKKKQAAKKKQQAQQQKNRPGLGRQGEGRGTGRLHTDAEEWGMLPPAVRDELLQTRGEGFPLKYRELLRRYYRELARPRE